ncbi:MAG: hypothetical protein KAS32_24795 [Candidatus Peribacteraceae bacterium]|nr:hypothetical protein [Candidatus Peribacteraceae bacterium]
MACKQYEIENPTRVMWPAGCGAKPIRREPQEPEYDDTIYVIEVAEREDLHGRNPLNPDKDELQTIAAAKRKARRNKPRQEAIRLMKAPNLTLPELPSMDIPKIHPSWGNLSEEIKLYQAKVDLYRAYVEQYAASTRAYIEANSD